MVIHEECVYVSIDVLREDIRRDGTTSALANTFAMSALSISIEGQFLLITIPTYKYM